MSWAVCPLGGHQLGVLSNAAPRAQAMPTPSTRLNNTASSNSNSANHSPPESGRRTGCGTSSRWRLMGWGTAGGRASRLAS